MTPFRATTASLRAVEDYTNKYKARVSMRVCGPGAAVRPHRDHTGTAFYNVRPDLGGYGTESHGHLVGHPHTHSREQEPDPSRKPS